MANEKRLIDANDALERLKKAEQKMVVVTMVGCKAVPMDGVIEFIQTRPTMDAVEVVRCEDCVHCEDIHGFLFCGCNNKGLVNVIEPDDFCSYGERKADGKT